MAYRDVTADELRRRLDAGETLFLLDVREPEEVAEWAFPGATNIPLGALAGRLDELPTDVPVVAICHAGIRSASAANALDAAGWTAENLAGGVIAWTERPA
ncbi:MAG TPA: rhodanese-like domain-containing protein [Acidimicrobiales bacterium]|nr:rhodanese-like domain-containing protein [Acidimicrobiales bacterium]